MANENTTKQSSEFNEKQLAILNELNRRYDEGGDFNDKQGKILGELNKRLNATKQQPTIGEAAKSGLFEGGIATSPTGQTVLKTLNLDPATIQTGLNALDIVSRSLGTLLPAPEAKPESRASALKRGRNVQETAPGRAIREAVVDKSLFVKAGIISPETQRKITGFAIDFFGDPLVFLPPLVKGLKSVGKIGEFTKLLRSGKEAEAVDMLKALPAPGIGPEGVPVSRIKPKGELPRGARFEGTPEGTTIPTSAGERAAQKAGRLERQVAEAGKAEAPQPTLYDVIQSEPKALPQRNVPPVTKEFSVYPNGEIMSAEQRTAIDQLGRRKALPAGKEQAPITRPGFIGREGKTGIKFRGLQQIPGTNDAVILVDLPNGSTVGLNEASHIVSKAEGEKIYNAIRNSNYDNVLTENKAIVAMGEKPPLPPTRGSEEIGAPLLSRKQIGAAKKRVAQSTKAGKEGESKVTITGETPLEKLTAKVKAGEATGAEIKQAAKTAPEETEAALRQEFKAAATPEEQTNIAQGIDIVTQEAGKKPKVPPTTKRGAPSGAQKVRTAIASDPNLRLKNSEIESIYGAGTEESKKLIKQIGGGKKTLDDVSLQLQEAGIIEKAPEGYNSQHLINLISEDAPTVAKVEQQAAKAAEKVYGKTAKEAPKIQERPTPPTPKGEKQKLSYDELAEGDEFTINGEKFEVTSKKVENGKTVGVRLKDSKKYEQDFGDFETGVEFDKGSLKKAGLSQEQTGQPNTFTVYRGSDKSYPTKSPKAVEGTYGKGVYYSGDEASAKVYGRNVEKYDVKLENPFIVKGDHIEGVPLEKMADHIENTLKPQGYDGIILTSRGRIHELIKFEKKPLEQLTKPLKEGESIPLQRATKEFTEKQAQAGSKATGLSASERKAKFTKKLESGKYEGDMFVEAEKGKQTSLLSGKDFGKGLINAVKQDIKGEKLGIVADPFRHVKEFISKNQLKLTDDEIEKLTNFARKAVQTEGATADDQVRMINDWIGKNLKVPVEAPKATTPIETLTGSRPPKVPPQYRKETFKTLERKWKQPMGAKESTTPGYNVNKMHPDLKDELPNIIEEFRTEFNTMRGQRLTTQQAIDSGIDFAGNLTDDAVMGLKRGDVTNASHLLGARIYVNNRLLEIADKMKSIPINASKETIGAITAENKHVLNMYMKVRSLGTETARALRFMQVPINDNLISGMKNYVEVLKNIDPKAAKSLSTILGDAEKLPTTTDKVLFWWYNSMLSNPFTDLANITGNASHTLWEMMINLGNNPSSVKGMFKSLPRGWKKGWEDAMAIYRQDKEFLNKFTTPEARARYDLYPKTKLGKFGRGLLPTTRLGMEDAIFSNIAKEMRIGIEAPKIASKTGLTTDDVLKGIRSVIENPRLSTGENDAIFREIADYADKYAEYVTFRSPLKSAFARGLQNTIWVKPFVPFARVTANISKAGFKNSPAAVIKFFQPGFKTLPLAERQDIVRRALAGSTFFAGIGAMMAAGKVEVTGSGPEDKKNRELWDKMGYKPNHIYVNNSDGSKTGISYQNINPFNVVLAVMGNWQDQYRFGKKLTDTEKTFSEKMSYALGGAAQTMTDQSFMQGVSRLFDWIKYKDEKYLEDFFTQPFIPNVVGFPRNIKEYVTGSKPRFEARNWWERVKRRVGLNEGLVPTYSAYGGQKESGYERFPYFASEVKRDPLLEDLREKNVLVSVPSKRTTIRNRIMTEAEYSDYVKISGNLIEQQLKRKQGTIKRMNAEQAQRLVDRIVDTQRRIAKSQIAQRAQRQQKPLDYFTGARQ